MALRLLALMCITHSVLGGGCGGYFEEGTCEGAYTLSSSPCYWDGWVCEQRPCSSLDNDQCTSEDATCFWDSNDDTCSSSPPEPRTSPPRTSPPGSPVGACGSYTTVSECYGHLPSADNPCEWIADCTQKACFQMSKQACSLAVEPSCSWNSGTSECQTYSDTDTLSIRLLVIIIIASSVVCFLFAIAVRIWAYKQLVNSGSGYTHTCTTIIAVVEHDPQPEYSPLSQSPCVGIPVDSQYSTNAESQAPVAC